MTLENQTLTNRLFLLYFEPLGIDRCHFLFSLYLFLSLVFANLLLYGDFKKAVAHVAYCAETGQDSEPAVRIEKQDNTGSYQK